MKIITLRRLFFGAYNGYEREYKKIILISLGILLFCSLPNLLALGLWGISLVAPDIATLHMQLAGHTIVIPDIGIASMYDTLVFAFGLFQQIGDRTLSMANPTDLFFGITSLASLLLSQFFYCVLIVAALHSVAATPSSLLDDCKTALNNFVSYLFANIIGCVVIMGVYLVLGIPFGAYTWYAQLTSFSTLMIVRLLVLAIVPLVFLISRYCLYPWALFDTQVGPLESFFVASRVTYGRRLQVFLYFLNIVAMVLVIKGLIWLLYIMLPQSEISALARDLLIAILPVPMGTLLYASLYTVLKEANLKQHV